MQHTLFSVKTRVLLFLVMVVLSIGWLSGAYAGYLSNDSHISAEILIGGEIDIYSFSAIAGDHVEIRMVDFSLTGELIPHMELYGPSGGMVLAPGQGFTVADLTYSIADTGVYTLLASSAAANNNVGPVETGAYELYYVKLPEAGELGILENDSVTFETIDSGDLDTYKFYASAGDHIELRMVDVSQTGELIPRIELYSPSGGPAVAAGQGFTVAALTYNITATGVYTLKAKSVAVNNNIGPLEKGDYKLYFTKLPEAGELGILENDSVTFETIDSGDLDTYKFYASAGDHIELRMVDVSQTGELIPRIELYSPSGGPAVAAGQAATVAILKYNVANTGFHTIKAKSAAVNNNIGPLEKGDYKLYFTGIPGANELGLIGNDSMRYEKIDLGDLDTYTIIADVGEQFYFEVSDYSLNGELIPSIELFGPSGGNPLMFDSDSKIASISFSANEIGTYTLLIKDGNNGSWASGEYAVNCVSSGDNDIDGKDLYLFSIGFDRIGDLAADVNGDGIVNLKDLERFAREFGKSGGLL